MHCNQMSLSSTRCHNPLPFQADANPRILACVWRQISWQSALMPLVSAWAGGMELEPTDIYGMRIYQRGAVRSADCQPIK